MNIVCIQFLYSKKFSEIKIYKQKYTINIILEQNRVLPNVRITVSQQKFQYVLCSPRQIVLMGSTWGRVPIVLPYQPSEELFLVGPFVALSSNITNKLLPKMYTLP